MAKGSIPRIPITGAAGNGFWATKKDARKFLRVPRLAHRIRFNLRKVPALGSLCGRVRIWWNWQTRYFEVVVGQPVQVQVLLCAPLFLKKLRFLVFCPLLEVQTKSSAIQTRRTANRLTLQAPFHSSRRVPRL